MSAQHSIRCGSCGEVLSESPSIPELRPPCPKCGSKIRCFEETINCVVNVTSDASDLHERRGEAIGFGGFKQNGLRSSASLDPDGALRHVLSGVSPQGEADTMRACKVLLEHLEQEGFPYTTCIPGKTEPADCTLVDGATGTQRLDVQMVRAIASQRIWRELGTTGSSQPTLRPEVVVRAVRATIEGKANKLPPSVRATLVLALDATRLPGLGFDAMVRSFRAAEGSWTMSLGFKAVWLIGPTPRLTWRLDLSS